MDSFRIDVSDPATAEALRREAEAHGRSAEAEIGALVERAYGSAGERAEDWIDELIEMLPADVELALPPQVMTTKPPPFLYDDFS